VVKATDTTLELLRDQSAPSEEYIEFVCYSRQHTTEYDNVSIGDCEPATFDASGYMEPY
jgi:hypothetical protein